MKEHNSKLTRRNFLLTVGAGGAAAAATLVAKAPATSQSADKSKRSGAGYAESAHIRNYYRTTKV